MNFQGHARPMDVPRRGSVLSLASRFGASNGRMDRPNDAFHFVQTIDRGSDFAILATKG